MTTEPEPVGLSVCPACGHVPPVGSGVWLACRDCGWRWFTGKITTTASTTTIDRGAG